MSEQSWGKEERVEVETISDFPVRTQAMEVTKFFDSNKEVSVEIVVEPGTEYGIFFTAPIEIFGVQSQHIRVNSDVRF